MRLIPLILFSLTIGISLSQYDDETTTNNPEDEGCEGEEFQEHVFEAIELFPIDRCQQLNRAECMTYHQARQICPCVCKRRKMYYNPDGVRRGEDVRDDDPLAKYSNTKYKLKPIPTTPAGGEGGVDGLDGNFCFSGESLVQTRTGPVPMSELASMSDVEILSWNRAQNTLQYSPVNYWLHADPSVHAKFVHLFADDTQLLITEKHLIYRSTTCDPSNVETVFVEDLRVGECLLTRAGDKIRLSNIAKIEAVYKTGIYAPVTAEGSVVVDNVVASCFAQNPDEKLQKVLQSYVILARNALWSLLPNNIFAQLFGGESDVSVVFLALERLQRSFL